MVFWSFLLLAQYIPFLWQENSSTSIPRRHPRTNTIPPVSFFSLLRTLLLLSVYSNLLQKTRATDIDLASLSTTQGFSILGAAAGDYSGISVAPAGDVNGDGFQDIIIGANTASPNSRSTAGTSYVIYGGASLTTIDLASLSATQGFKILGAAAYYYSGTSVAPAGDINGDGFDDILIGANGANPSSRTSAGTSYVIYGNANLTTIDLASLSATQGLSILGAAAGDQSGRSVASAGDINGDGFDDILIGAYQADPNSRADAGTSYVVYGNITLPNIDLANLTSSQGFKILGALTNEYSGVSVASAGDINGDGFGDILAGAIYADPNGRSNAGTSYVIYGGNSLSNIDLASFTTDQGFTKLTKRYACYR